MKLYQKEQKLYVTENDYVSDDDTLLVNGGEIPSVEEVATRVPELPSAKIIANKSYVLTATVSADLVVTYTWVDSTAD